MGVVVVVVVVVVIKEKHNNVTGIHSNTAKSLNE